MLHIIIDVYTKMSKYAVTLYTGKQVAIKNRPQRQYCRHLRRQIFDFDLRGTLRAKKSSTPAPYSDGVE